MSMPRADYEQAIISAWRELPCTRGRPPRSDRILLRDLYARRIPLSLIFAAFRLASRRRSPHLPPVRSLSYFRDVIDELTHADPGYIDFLNAHCCK